MKWVEIERSIIASVQAKQTKASEPFPAIVISEEEKRQELIRLNTTLEQLHVREALQAIRDDVWEEGELREIEGNIQIRKARTGLKLVSDPYPALFVTGEGKGLEVEVLEARASLGVVVESYVGIQDSTEVMVCDSSIYGVDRETGVAQAISKYGLERGLRRLALGNCNLGVGLDWQLPEDIDPAEPDALEQFYATLFYCVSCRRTKNNLPSQIRAWSNNLFRQLPSSLLEQRKLASTELRDWGHEVRGSSRLVRALDRVLPLPVGV